MKTTSLLLSSLFRSGVLAVMLSTTACSGGNSGDGGGNESYTPPATSDGTGQRPSGATEIRCEVAEDCGFWYCECQDGAIVNSANCTNGYCLDAPSSCPSACEAFDHGNWSGSATGGPSVPTPTPDPPPTSSCGDQGSTSEQCWSCIESECCGESAACYGNPDCLDYWDCLYDCGFGDPSCESYCGDLHPFGVTDYDNLAYCADSYCTADCG